MNDTKTLLTLELVTAHRERIYDLELCVFTNIEPPAAALLSSLKQYLNLSGLTSPISPTHSQKRVQSPHK